MAGLKKCLGVDLGTNAVKVVELTYDKKGIRATRAGMAEVSLESSATVEEQRSAIVSTFKDVLKKNKFSCRDAVFAIPGVKVFIRRFPLPAASPERLNRIVAYEARQQIPFDIDKTDLQWEFFDIPGSDEVEVLLVAVRLDEIKSYMSLVNKCGVRAVAVAVTSLALFNAQTFFDSPAQSILEQLGGGAKKAKPDAKKAKGGFSLSLGKKKPAEQPVEETPEESAEPEEFFDSVKGFVNIGASTHDLMIATQNPKKAYLKFPRSVPAGGNDITRAIMKNCSVSSFLDAERIKKHQTALMTSSFEPEGADINEDACMAATKAADRIVGELRKSLDFFISQPDGMAVDSLVISGGLANLPGMAEYIEEKLSVPVEVRNAPPADFPFQWPQDVSLSDYVIATGLALQGLGLGTIHVDFLPEDRKISRDFPVKLVAVLAILLAVSIAFLSQAGKVYTAQYRTKANDTRSVLSRNEPLVTARTKAQDRRNEVANLYTELSKVAFDRLYWFDFLEKISDAKPSAVVINQLNMGHDGQIQLVGVSQSPASAAAFNNALVETFPEATSKPQLLRADPVPGPQFGFPQDPTVYLFRIEFTVHDKINRLEVTPTPAPNAAGNTNPNAPGRPLAPGGNPGQPPAAGGGRFF